MNDSDNTPRPANGKVFTMFVFVIIVITGFAIKAVLSGATFQYYPSANTSVAVEIEHCFNFGRMSRVMTVRNHLRYEVNGVDNVIKDNEPNLSGNIGVKACTVAFTRLADQYGYSKDNVYQRFQTSLKDNVPYLTAHYLNSSKLNAMTMPIEACVNPQFEGPVTFSYQDKVFHSTTVNKLEHELGYLSVLTEACRALKKSAG